MKISLPYTDKEKDLTIAKALNVPRDAAGHLLHPFKANNEMCKKEQ